MRKNRIEYIQASPTAWQHINGDPVAITTACFVRVNCARSFLTSNHLVRASIGWSQFNCRKRLGPPCHRVWRIACANLSNSWPALRDRDLHHRRVDRRGLEVWQCDKLHQKSGVLVRDIRVLPVTELTCTQNITLEIAGIAWKLTDCYKRKNSLESEF